MGPQIPTTEEVLKKISNGKTLNLTEAVANTLGWLAHAIKTLQDIWGLLTVVVVIIGLGITLAGYFTHNARWKSSGINAIIAALVSLVLVHLLPIAVLAIEQALR